MVYLAFAYSIGTHGGGTHQWNLHDASVQYQKKVSHYAMTFDALEHEWHDDVFENTVYKLFGPDIQRIASRNKMLHSAPDLTNILLSQPRSRLLAYHWSNRGQHHLLYRLLLRSNLSLLSTRQDLE